MSNTHYRISAKAMILNDARDKFLVVLEKSGKWDLPGGGLEHGESVAGCLRREIEHEEMGVPVVFVAEEPSYFLRGQFENPERRGQWYANVIYKVQVGHLDIRPSNECGAVRFVDADEAKALHAFDAVYELAKMFKPG